MTNEEAINLISRNKSVFQYDTEMTKALDFAINALKERPQGEWLWLGDNPSPSHKWSCNKCGRGVKEQENFCPNCGAEMRGAEND